METLSYEQWYREVLSQFYGHRAAENRYSRRHRLLGIPVVILTTVVGSTAFSSLGQHSSSTFAEGIKVLVVVLSLSAAILSALQTFLGWAELSQRHANAKGKFAKLKIGLEAVMVGGDEADFLRFIEENRAEWCAIQEESPNVPDDLALEVAGTVEARLNEARESSFEEIRCEGQLEDKYLGEDGEITEMRADRCWTYDLEEVVIRKYRSKATVHFVTRIQSPHSDHEELYDCRASGPLADGVAFLQYEFRGRDVPSEWMGTMVLRIPQRGLIEGFWVTTNVNRDNKFPIGSVSLHRTG